MSEGKFKSASETIWDSITNKRISVKFGYNVDDYNFWDSSLVWRKGARIPGYYNFQTIGNVTPESENPILILPPFEYSDSIKKLFSQ